MGTLNRAMKPARIVPLWLIPAFILLSWRGATAAEPIRIGYSALGGAFTPLWCAQDEGYFKRRGLEAQTIYIAGGAVAVQALLAGDIQFALAGATAAVRASLNGADLKLIANTIDAMDFHLVAKPEIASIKELKGKKIGVTRLGGNTDFALEIVLGKAGLQRGRDVAVLQTGGMPQMMGALEAGRIDAGVISAILGLSAVKGGFRRLVDFGDLAIPYPLGPLIARESYILTHRDATLRFLRAYVEALQKVLSDRETALKVLAKYTRVRDPQILAETYRIYRARYLVKIHVDLDGLANLLRFELHESDGSKAERFVDNSFVAELEREGLFEKLHR
jgi:NitT/TauT family transport system substrate-binding protein